MKKMISNLALFILFFMSGCSSSETDELKTLEVYLESFTASVQESNELLKKYNTNLDQLYTRQLSEMQLAEETKQLVKRLNALVSNLDEQLYIVEGPLYEFHSQYIALINRQHRLFLNTVDEALGERSLNKDQFSKEFESIKQEQTRMIQTLNGLFTES